jgi:alpha-L-rhamnosidase
LAASAIAEAIGGTGKEFRGFSETVRGVELMEIRSRVRFLLRSLIVSIAMLAAAASGESQMPSGLKAQLWPAKWITSDDAPARDEAVLYFRKHVELATPARGFVVNVSADNRFVLYVNGQRAGSGPARSDLAHWRYETLDVGPLLKNGDNVFAAVVWNLGGRSALAQISDRTAFLLAGASEAESAVNTGTEWDVAVETAIHTLPKPMELGGYYYAAEPSLRIDGATFAWGWNSGASTPWLTWKKAAAIGSGAQRGASLQENNWQLTADPLPQMTMERQSMGTVVRKPGVDIVGAAANAEYKIAAHSHATLLLDRGYLTTAYPEFAANGGAGATVRLTYAEALLDANQEKGNRNEIEGKHIVGVFDEFALDGANGRVYGSLVWRTWRYVQIDVTTADQPLHLSQLQSWFSAFPFEEKAKFASDEADLQKIWEIGWRTARLDAHDTYMDTPYWEEMQYIGDTRIQALISYSVAGDDRLARQAITAFNNSRVPDGITLSRYPTSMFQAIPTFSLLWLGMVHDFWMYRDDPAFVQEQLAGTRTTLDWFMRHQRADGLLDTLFWWPFVDWGSDFGFGVPPQDPDGGSTSMALQFVEALRNAADLEIALGEPARADIYRAAAQRAVSGVKKLCWNQQYALFADTPAQKHFSQHANILAVWLDVVPREQQQDVLTRILSSTDAGFHTDRNIPPMTAATYYFRFYLARAIEHAGLGDRYLELLAPWRTMVSLGLTTWAEQPEPTRSDSHAWSAHPNYDLLRIVAGIRPAKPGFASVVIEPHLGALKHVQATEPHPGGSIDVEFTRAAGAVNARVSLPSATPGVLIWLGKSYPLHAGEQTLSLPAH